VEVAQAHLDRAAACGELGAFITLDREGALGAAAAADAALARGEALGPLHGVPIAVKDMLPTRGLRTTAGSEALHDWVPEEDAAAVASLRAAGAVILGKTHTTEFSVWATGTHARYRLPRNPWDRARVPGGSSTGSAIAVAAGLAPAALGTDTGGSVRIPAALCGVVGLKPTRDLVSTDGTIPLSRSLDHVGVIARRVRDVAAVLAAVRRDRRTPPLPTRTDLRGVRVGRLAPVAPAHPEVADAVREAERVLAALGAQHAQASLPMLARALDLSEAIQYPELLAYHGPRLGERRQASGSGLSEGFAAGAVISPSRHTRAKEESVVLARAADRVLADHDVLLLPTVGIPAPRIGETHVQFDGHRQAVDAVLSEYTRAFNLTGHPAISVPCGRTAGGLPIGLQLVARHGGDDALLEIAHAYEQAAAVNPPPTRDTTCCT
jgi:aspartyl-tRNA(Asn)/glutamyl-tRNA(Gln) amidotransferase subunit A